MRESSSRSIATNSNNNNNGEGGTAGLMLPGGTSSFLHNGNATNNNNSNGESSSASVAGISSSGSSRSTERISRSQQQQQQQQQFVEQGYNTNNTNQQGIQNNAMQIDNNSSGNNEVTNNNGGDDIMEIMGGAGSSNNNSNNYHNHHPPQAQQQHYASLNNNDHYANNNNNNNYPPPLHNNNNNNHYASAAGDSSSSTSSTTQGGISTFDTKVPHHNHHHQQQHQPPTQHYSQYSLPYPGELTVYSWGRGEDGQLGIGDTSDQDEPTYVDSLRGVGVKQIACGSGHTVVLTGEGEVYTWGRGDDGRLGHGDNGWKYVPRLTHSLTGQVVTHVTCGSYHTAAVSSNGDLFTWGGGMYGKLGHGNESGHSTPRRVETLVGLTIVDIACGSRHTAVVTNKGCLYTWGDKENGVAGHGDTEGHQYTPKLLERLSGKKVVQLSACGFHTGCLTDMGEVYTWGEGKFGRLGHGAERNCHSPRLVESLLGKRPIQIACGGFHSAVVTQDGKMFTFGGGEHGQLGHGDKVNKVKPTLVQALDGIFLQQITCGWSHSVALTSKGEVYTWGNGDHGKLGHGSGKKVSTPQLVEKLVGQKVVRVASYNEHTACLIEPHSVTTGGGSRRAAPGTMVPISAGFLHDMKEMVNDEEYSDVTFVVEGRPVYALRAVLAKRCEHFAAMFRSGMRECEDGAQIPIPNMSYAVFLMILEYLYTDSVKVELEHAVELYIASDLYQLGPLRDMCCVVVRRSIGAENAAYLLQSAHEAHCHVMKDIAMEYIVANFDIISKSDGIKAVSHGLLLEILSLRP